MRFNGFRDPVHQGGFAAAGPSLEYVDLLRLGGVDELIVQRIKAARGICTQKEPDLRLGLHKMTSKLSISHSKVCGGAGRGAERWRRIENRPV